MHKKPKQIYVTHEPLTAHQVLEKAAEILASQFTRDGCFNSPEATKQYLSCKLGSHEREVFAVLLLDTQHRLIEYKEVFYGTIDAASVYPREIVKLVLEYNSAAVIIAHNHPSGISDPSQADKVITRKLIDALALVDVRVLDHIVVGETTLSFAEMGLL
jgi:DNA repair protein RadC